MPIPFVLIDLTSVTGYVTDVSDIYISSKDPTKIPVKYFDFMVHSKEKVTRAVYFSPQKRPFVTSPNGLTNEGIECKKFKSFGFKRLFIIQFLGSIKNFIKLRQKGTSVRNTVNSEHLEFMLCIREGKR